MRGEVADSGAINGGFDAAPNGAHWGNSMKMPDFGAEKSEDDEKKEREDSFLQKIGGMAAKMARAVGNRAKMEVGRVQNAMAGDALAIKYRSELESGKMPGLSLEETMAGLERMSSRQRSLVLRSSYGVQFLSRYYEGEHDFASSGLLRDMTEGVCGHMQDVLAGDDEWVKKELGRDVKHLLTLKNSTDVFSVTGGDKERDEIFQTLTSFDGVSKTMAAAATFSPKMLIERANEIVDERDSASVADADKILRKLDSGSKRKIEEFLRNLPKEKRTQFNPEAIEWGKEVLEFGVDEYELNRDMNEVSSYDLAQVRRRAYVMGFETRNYTSPKHDPVRCSFAREMLTGGTQLAREAAACDLDDLRLEKLAYYLSRKSYMDNKLGFVPQSIEDFDEDFDEVLRKSVKLSLDSAEKQLKDDDESWEARSEIWGAWDDLCRLAIGMRPGRAIFDLVSCGVLKMNDNVRDAVEALGPLGSLDINAEFENAVGPVGSYSLDLGERYEEMTDDEKVVAMSVLGLLFCESEKQQDSVDFLRKQLEVFSTKSISGEVGGLLTRLMERQRREMTEKMQRRLQEEFEKNTKPVGFVKGKDGEMIEVLEMDADSDAMMLVTNLGIFSHNTENRYLIKSRHPERWNGGSRSLAKEDDLNRADAKDNPVGYISTSLITPKKQAIAGSDWASFRNFAIVYGFLNLGESSVMYMREQDIWSKVARSGSYMRDVGDVTVRMGGYQEPTSEDEILKKTKSYSEVVLDRFGGDPDVYDGRIQPAYVLSFGGSKSRITNTQVRHAQYFRRKVLNPETGEMEDKPVPIVLLKAAKK